MARRKATAEQTAAPVEAPQSEFEEMSVSPISNAMRLLQFGDSMLPVGAFSFSNALESAIQQGVVTDAETLASFVRTSTRRAATSDGIALLEAHRATRARDHERLIVIDRAVVARKLDEELHLQTVRMGKKLLEIADKVVGSAVVTAHLAEVIAGETPGSFPVSSGIVSAELGLSEQEAFGLHQYGVAAAVLGAALRLMRVDHVATQKILFDVNRLVDTDYEDVSSASLVDMSTYAPMTDILAAVHVQSHVRMFMS